MRRAYLVTLAAALLAAPAFGAGPKPAQVEHPFLLWTKTDLAAMRRTIETEPWARAAYEQMEAGSGRHVNKELRDLFRYAVMGDAEAGTAARKRLVGLIGKPHPFGAAMQWRVLAYDLLHDDLTADERRSLEAIFREYIRYAIKPGGTYDTSVYNNERNYARYDGENGRYTRTNWLPNIIFPWKLSANLMAAALRDESLIRETWATHGSIQWYLDEYLGDSGFYLEEFSKMGSTPGALLLYGMALRNLGLDELGFGYQGKGGASIRGHIESVLRFTFPGVDTGTDRWRFERMSAGDVRPWLPFQQATVEGFFPNGDGGNKLWNAPGAWGGTYRGNNPQWDGYSGFTPKMQTRLWFECGHALWPDAGFGWFLARMRPPEADVYTPTLYFGLKPIDPKDTTPPPARSAVYPDRGFVMLRAEEGPDHWMSPAPAVALRLTSAYAHHVNDQLALCGYYALNRPIYQNPKSDPGYAFKFSRSIRSHCGVMVDGHVKKDDWGRTGSLEPAFTDNCTTRSDFNADVKFVAARTRERYPGVDETRALMLTREYLFDVFAARGTERHSYVWLVHTYGKAEPDAPAAWQPSEALADLVKELDGVRTLETKGRPWHLTVRQVRPETAPANGRLGDAWWSRMIGVRVHMLGQEDAAAHVADTPTPYSNRDESPPVPPVHGVTVAASRWGPSATFAALHVPFEGDGPPVAAFDEIARTDGALAARVRGTEGSGVDDRLLVRWGDSAAEPVTLEGGGERFTFAGHGFVRVGPDQVTVRGDVRALALQVGNASPALVVNGVPAKATVSGGALTWRK